MKRATRLCLSADFGENNPCATEVDVMLARQRAEIRDLKARLKHLQAATNWLDLDRRRGAFDLKNKKWRAKK